MAQFGYYALCITLIVLKAFEKIDWSWFWVLAPMWAPFAIFMTVFLGIAGLAALSGFLK